MLTKVELEQLQASIDGAIQRSKQPERLLSIDEVARRLDISKGQYFKHRLDFTALGLQEVKKGTSVSVRESSLDQLIRKAVERQIDLFKPMAS